MIVKVRTDRATKRYPNCTFYVDRFSGLLEIKTNEGEQIAVFQRDGWRDVEAEVELTSQVQLQVPWRQELQKITPEEWDKMRKAVGITENS